MSYSNFPSVSEFLSKAELQSLSAKYGEMLALRASRKDCEALGQKSFEGEAALSRRQRFRALATEFPGSLREMELSEALLQARHDTVLALSHQAAVAPAWLVAVSLYHHSLREALNQRVASPENKRQRLPSPSIQAWQQVADALGVTRKTAEALVFPK